MTRERPQAVKRHEQYLLKYFDACSASYLKISATKIPGITISPRPSMEKGVEVSPSSRALGNNSLIGASKDFACTADLFVATQSKTWVPQLDAKGSGL